MRRTLWPVPTTAAHSHAAPATTSSHESTTMKTSLRTLLLPVALVGALGTFAAGCGDGGIDQSKIEDVQKKGDEIKAKAAEAQKVAEDIQSGKVSAEEGQKQIEAKTEEITNTAKKAGTDALEAVEDNKYLSDEDKKQIADAKDQLKTTTP